MQSLLVKDYMVVESSPIRPEMNVAQAVDELLKRHLSGAAVLSEGNVVGFLSEKDCIRHITQSNYFQGGSPTVSDIMVKNVMTVDPNTSILSVAEMMWSRQPKIYPVCESGKLVGYIDRHNVLRALQDAGVIDS